VSGVERGERSLDATKTPYVQLRQKVWTNFDFDVISS